MRITSKGQVTIPVEIREKAGLFPGTEVANPMVFAVVSVGFDRVEDLEDALQATGS